MCSFTQPVAVALCLVVSAGSDSFYDFYVVHSDSVLKDVRLYGQLIREILPPVPFVGLNGFLLTQACMGNDIPHVYCNYV